MAIFRPIPKCSFCGKSTVKGVYKSYKGIPSFLIPIGDSFLNWDSWECNCRGHRKWKKEMKMKRSVSVT